MATLLQITQFPNATSGTIYSYDAGTSTPKNMLADQAGTPLGTSYLLSSSGSVPTTGIWLEGAYKLIIKDSDGVTLYTFDNVDEYDSLDFSGLTATISDLNSTSTTALTKTSTYNVQVGDRGKTILANAVSGNININLPSAAEAGNKFMIRIKKIDVSTNIVIIDPSGTQTVDSLTTFQLLNYFDSVILQCDGSNWLIVAAKLRDTVQSITSSRELKLANDIRLFLSDASSGAIELKLPSPTTVGKGWRVGAKKIDSSTNIVTFKQNATETIDGQTEIGLGNQYAAAELITDGVNWHIANEYNNISDEPYPRGTLNDMSIENYSGDYSHDIKFNIGAARSFGNLYNIAPLTPIIKRIDANWVAGSGNGGFPSSLSLLPNTCYHTGWIIKPNGEKDAGYDSAITFSNLLADATGYTDYIRVGSIYTDSSSNIYPFLCLVNKSGRYFYFKNPFNQIIAPNPGTAGILATMLTPTGISVNAILSNTIEITNGLLLSGAIGIYISSPDVTDQVPGDINFTNAITVNTSPLTNFKISTQVHVLTNTSSQIRYRLLGSDPTLTVYITTLGWIE